MDAGGGPLLPDSVLYEIFLYLDHVDVLSAGLVCQQWRAVARDEFLWKELFYRYYRISREVPRHPGALARGDGAGAAARGAGCRPGPAEQAQRPRRAGGLLSPGASGGGPQNLPAVSPEERTLSPSAAQPSVLWRRE